LSTQSEHEAGVGALVGAMVGALVGASVGTSHGSSCVEGGVGLPGLAGGPAPPPPPCPGAENGASSLQGTVTK